jgi:hypothetical protein
MLLLQFFFIVSSKLFTYRQLPHLRPNENFQTLSYVKTVELLQLYFKQSSPLFNSFTFCFIKPSFTYCVCNSTLIGSTTFTYDVFWSWYQSLGRAIVSSLNTDFMLCSPITTTNEKLSDSHTSHDFDTKTNLVTCEIFSYVHLPMGCLETVCLIWVLKG